MKTTSLPFELDRDEISAHDIPAQGIRGTVSLKGDHIVIQYALQADVGTSSDQPAQTVPIPLRDVEKLAMTGGAVKSPRLLLETYGGDVLNELPWADGRMVVMRFRRADGQKLRELIEEVEVVMAAIRTKREE